MAPLAQTAIAVTRDVIYKHEPGHDLPLDIYEPSSYLATPVDIHGGEPDRAAKRTRAPERRRPLRS